MASSPGPIFPSVGKLAFQIASFGRYLVFFGGLAAPPLRRDFGSSNRGVRCRFELPSFSGMRMGGRTQGATRAPQNPKETGQLESTSYFAVRGTKMRQSEAAARPQKKNQTSTKTCDLKRPVSRLREKWGLGNSPNLGTL